MRCIIVDSSTGRIVNFIEADPERDALPDGQVMFKDDPDNPITRDYMMTPAGWRLTPEAAQSLSVAESDAVAEAWADG
jgi:hypothetical protein